MRLLLNEVTEAEQIIDGAISDITISEALSLISRYYRQMLELSPKETKSRLYQWLLTQLNSCNVDDWDEFIDKLISNAKKYPLLQVDKIYITKSEISKIQTLKKKNQQKLAFTLLVLAKYGNLKSVKNNSWVLIQQYKAFQLARVVGDSRWSTMRELKDAGLIDFAHKVDNINVRVTFIDDDSEPELAVSDLRELGYQYLRYTGEEFVECRECGVLVRKTCINKKYCKDCAGYQPIIKKKVQCIDCGEWFEVDNKNTKTMRCSFCQEEKNKENGRKRINKLRNIGNCNATN